MFLAGWVDVRRDLGNLIFLDLRDHTGKTQVVCNPAISAEVHDRAEEVRSEYRGGGGGRGGAARARNGERATFHRRS